MLVYECNHCAKQEYRVPLDWCVAEVYPVGKSYERRTLHYCATCAKDVLGFLTTPRVTDGSFTEPQPEPQKQRSFLQLLGGR